MNLAGNGFEASFAQWSHGDASGRPEALQKLVVKNHMGKIQLDKKDGLISCKHIHFAPVGLAFPTSTHLDGEGHELLLPAVEEVPDEGVAENDSSSWEHVTMVVEIKTMTMVTGLEPNAKRWQRW